MNRTKLESAISVFVKNKKANAAYYDDNWTERKERKAYYQSFTKDKLLAMNCTIATAQPNCNGQTLSKMVLPPPLTEQKRIVAKLEELLPLCERLK